MSYACKTLIRTANNLASREKRLSICLGAGGFSFAEVAHDGHLLAFGESEGYHAHTMTGVMADLKELFASIGIKPLGYAQMELIVLSDVSAWIPDELYSSISSRQYIRMLGGTSDMLLTCHDAKLSSTAVFSANEHVVTAFKVAMPGVNVIHQHSKIARLADNSSHHPLLLVHWRKGMIDVAAMREGQYLFGNTLSFQSLDEAVFHMVETMKCYALESPDMEVLLCGDVDRSIYATCSPYFPKVTLFSPIDLTSQAAEFYNLPTYKHALILI